MESREGGYAKVIPEEKKTVTRDAGASAEVGVKRTSKQEQVVTKTLSGRCRR